MRDVLRGLAALTGFVLVTLWALYGGSMLISWAADVFPAAIGLPSSDPHGRGTSNAADIGVGAFICFLLGIVGGWLAWLWTDRNNWSVDLLISTPVFLLFSCISASNYINLDILYTIDAQAILNFMLASSGAVIVLILQKTLKGLESLFVILMGSLVLMFCIWAFVAIPVWYSFSFLSWKLGAGKLDSMNSAAKAVSGAASLLAVIGLQWKNGVLTPAERK